jgi:tetratricopeptide (TPR) repeat protein
MGGAGSVARQEKATRDLAAITNAHGQLDGALEVYKASLKTKLKTFSANHERVAECENNMAIVLWGQQKIDEAIVHDSKALSIRLNTRYPVCLTPVKEDVSAADTYNDIACLLELQKDMRHAADYYSSAASIYSTCLGIDAREAIQARNTSLECENTFYDVWHFHLLSS